MIFCHGTSIHIGVSRKQFGKRLTNVMEQSPSPEANIRLAVQEILRRFGKRKFSLFLVLVTKSTKARKYINMSYITNIVFLLPVSTSLVVILKEVPYKGWIYRDITKICEPKHRCKILSFKNIWFNIHIKTQNTDTIL